MRIQKIGLKWAIFGSFSLALVLILLSLFVIVPSQAEKYLLDQLRERGNQMAKEIERDHAAHLDPSGEPTLFDVPTGKVTLAMVLACMDSDCRVLKPVAMSRGSEPTLPKPVLAQFDQAGRPVWRELAPDGERLLLVGLQFERTATRPGGWVLVVLPRAEIDTVLDELRKTVLIALLIGCALFLLLVWAISRVFILRPVTSMMSVASKLSAADLSGRVEEPSTSELGALADALNTISQSLRDTVGRVRGVSDAVAQVIEQLSLTGTTVSSGAGTILTRVEETSSSMAQMMESLRGIAQNVEVLYHSAEESSSSILQMAATNDEVAENVQAMAASVEETTGAIEQMTFSIKQVAENIEQLLASAEETSSSMSEMDVSIGQVETNANETARLSEHVSKDAETGVEALRKTLHGIDKIKESSKIASGVIEQLGRRIEEISNIVNVIDDVAEQTNLLALNAAIIAAQAGEHGKGFAVVAEEIKDLAERTGVSTKEIADLIEGVQQEARNAVSAMNQGVRNVEEGVQLGREAESALRKISESANKSTVMVKAIANATVEQARGSKQVTTAIHRIAETVQQISKASREQARGSEQIMKSAEKMKLLTNHVQHSSQEQARGSKQIIRSIESINEMVTHLNRAQKEQTQGSEQVLEAVEAIKAVSEHQARSVKQLEAAIEALQQQAEVLRAEARRFRM